MVDRSEESLNVLMDAYRVYQETQKHTEATTRVDLESDPDDKTHQRLLVEAYHKYSCLTVSYYRRLLFMLVYLSSCSLYNRLFFKPIFNAALYCARLSFFAYVKSCKCGSFNESIAKLT